MCDVLSRKIVWSYECFMDPPWKWPFLFVGYIIITNLGIIIMSRMHYPQCGIVTALFVYNWAVSLVVIVFGFAMRVRPEFLHTRLPHQVVKENPGLQEYEDV